MQQFTTELRRAVMASYKDLYVNCWSQLYQDQIQHLELDQPVNKWLEQKFDQWVVSDHQILILSSDKELVCYTQGADYIQIIDMAFETLRGVDQLIQELKFKFPGYEIRGSVRKISLDKFKMLACSWEEHPSWSDSTLDASKYQGIRIL